MKEIQVALIAIALVLSAVFLPMAFFGGSTGRHLPPVLAHDDLGDGAVGAGRADPQPGADRDACSSPRSASMTCPRAGWAARRRALARVHRPRQARLQPPLSAMRSTAMKAASTKVIDRKWRFLGIYAVIVVLLAVLFVRLPSGFLPTEDQGSAQHSDSAPWRRHPAAHARGARPDREVSADRGRRECPHAVPRSPAAGGGGRAARIRAAASSTSCPGTTGRARTAPPMRSSSGCRAPSAVSATRGCSRWCPARCAGSASRTASPCSCSTARACRPSAVRRSARPAARNGRIASPS